MSSKQLLPLSGVLSVLIIIAAFITGGETPEADDSWRKSSPTTTITTPRSR